MSQSPQSKPFYCYPHSNGSGIYQVEIRDRITGVMLPRKSTVLVMKMRPIESRGAGTTKESPKVVPVADKPPPERRV